MVAGGIGGTPSGLSDWCLRRQVRVSLPLENGVWICDHLQAHFVLGLLRPRIYLDSQTETTQMAYIIGHEKAHLQRGDHWWKAIGFLLLIVYWFNPLLWLAFSLFCRDIELACDEKVIANLGKDGVIAYAETLLDSSMHRHREWVYPLAFGEIGVKERVNYVLQYKKPALGILIAGIVACLLLAVCFLTDPLTQKFSYATLAQTESTAWTHGEYLAVRDTYGDGDYRQEEVPTADVTEYLQTVNWQSCRFPAFGVEKEGWVRFTLSPDCQVLVEQGKGQATVIYEGETQRYRLQDGDFDRALAVFNQSAGH